MDVNKQISQFIAAQSEPKKTDLQTLHNLVIQILPKGKLWFDSGVSSDNKTTNNPTIGYGLQTIRYADGSSKPFFQIGISGNATGISVYILGIKDKSYLANTFGKTIGKAKVTGYCIRFKKLQDIDIQTLEAAMRYGISVTAE